MRVPRNLPFLVKLYFIVSSVILVTFAFFYSSSLIRRMSEQSASTTHLFSKFIAMELKEIDDSNRRDLIREIQGVIKLPFVITDMKGRPMVWNRIGILQVKDDEFERLREFDPEAPDDPLLEEVWKKAVSFDQMNVPIPIDTPDFSLLIHYGPSALSRELALAPYVQLAVFVLFMLFGFLGFRTVKIVEQRSIWVGMAKETAHQLGTPLSSIMGWLSMVREEVQRSECSEKLETAIREASADIDRLSRISARFSKIGSVPKLEYQKLHEIIEDTVNYFERRRPSLKINSTIEVDIEELPLIRCSRDLLEWVFENLIKNSIDAIAGNRGKINIAGRMNHREKKVELTFSDSGKGMSPAVRKRIFSPGYTTKNRGWGLGLALAKRIVEEIHRGTIKVLSSQPDKGTTFLISFPVD